MAKGLTEAQREAFRRDGFITPLRAIDERRAAAAVRSLEAVERRYAHLDRSERDHKLLRFKAHLLFTWLDAIAHCDRILDTVEDLIGPDILIWSSSLFIKEPHDPGFFGWHQDSYTYALEGDDLVTAWVALSPVTVANGAMRFLPGTHGQGRREHRDTFHEHSLGSRGEELVEAVDDAGAVDIELEPGEYSLHHLQLMHESRPNASEIRRVGYAIRYIPPRMRHLGGAASVCLARGSADSERWRLEPRPARDLDEAAVAAFQLAVGERMSETFEGATETERAQAPEL